MIIEEEQNNNQTKDITASELYAKFDDWNKDLIKKMDSIGKKDKKLYYKYKDMQLKFTSNISPLEGIELIDIKLNSRIYEDDIFMEENFISEYLRRGESLLYNKKDNTYDYARIGLPKFFDYKKEFLQDNKKDKMQQERVIGNLLKINKGNRENVKYFAYLTTKVNGENFQISYNKKYSCWIIASKNVSIAVRNKDDLNFYKNAENFEDELKNNINELLDEKEKKKIEKKEKKKAKKLKKQERLERRKKNKDEDNKEKEENEEDENENKININEENEKTKKKEKVVNSRYSYALEFAETWFNLLEERIIKKNLLEQFISELGDYTLIGESVGDKKREHILVYQKRDIIFYGIVNNKKLLSEKCLPLCQSFDLFKKYNLSFTEIQPSEKYTSLNDLFTYINTQFDVIFDKSLEESGEGNVVYFSCEIDGKESIQNLGKLKTFEYRFFRKIREKCKGVPPPVDKTKIESEEIKKVNNKKKEKDKKKKNKKKEGKNESDEESKKQEEEKEKNRIKNNVEKEFKHQNEEREKKIKSLIKKIKNESLTLLSEVKNSKYNTDPVLQKKYFDFAEYIIKYKAIDNTNYFDVFASFIKIMREKYELKEEINEKMINEIKKKFEGLIELNDDNEENDEEKNEPEDAKDE